jgi:hypothetical protein
MVVVVLAALLALWIHQLLFAVLPAGIRLAVLRVLCPAAALAGAVLAGLALADIWYPVFSVNYPEGRGLSLSVGILLLAYAAHLLRHRTAERRGEQLPQRAPPAAVLAEWGAVAVLVSIGLFWAVGNYAIGVGTGRARQVESSLSTSPDAVVYSEKKLNLQAPGVREVICAYPDTAYRFRYDGLKLVQQSGNQYLFLPAGWTHDEGAAIFLSRSEALRLEFSPPGQVRSADC